MSLKEEKRHCSQGEDHAAKEAEVEVTLPRPKQGYQQPPKLGEARRDSFLESSERASPANILILDFWPPEL